MLNSYDWLKWISWICLFWKIFFLSSVIIHSFSLDSMYYKQYHLEKTALSISHTHNKKTNFLCFFRVFQKLLFSSHFSLFTSYDRSRIQFCVKFTNNVYSSISKKKNFFNFLNIKKSKRFVFIFFSYNVIFSKFDFSL